MDKEITRRDLLRFGGITAAGITVGSALAACQPTATGGGNGGDAAGELPVGAPSSSAVATDGIGSGNQPYPWGSAPAISDADVEETIDCDVLVAGTGIAGACAILAAAEEGAKVFYCDKQDAVSSSSGDITVWGSNDNSVQRNWGRVNKYDWDIIIDHEVAEGSGFPSRAIWGKFGHNNGDVFQWYIQPFIDLGGELIIAKTEAEGNQYMMSQDYTGWIKPLFYPDPVDEDGNTYDAMKVVAEGGDPCFLTSVRCDQPSFNRSCVQKAEEQYGATGVFRSKLAQLIKEGDKITGGYVYMYDTGTYKKVNAAKGVILATGDYSGNKDMEAYFLPDVYKNGISGMGFATDPAGEGIYQGDHLLMGDWAGAAIQQHHAPMIHHMGNMGIQCAASSGMFCPGVAPYLRLNTNGVRFMNEDLPGQQTENQIEGQPGMMCYEFWDSHWLDKSKNFPPRHGSFNGADIETKWFDPSTAVEAFQESIDAGSVKMADTIEGLLDAINQTDDNWKGIDKEQALKSIQRYQELCRAGKDEDFHKDSKILTSFETGPFFATYFVPAANLINIGGLVSDDKSRVYTKEGKAIGGLYVAGNTQGGKFCVQYPIALEGVASSMCMYYGYIAGKEAAGKDTSSGM
jgi:succinate dehydrogenase/fumarate reductase flavoprotein subunit